MKETSDCGRGDIPTTLAMIQWNFGASCNRNGLHEFEAESIRRKFKIKHFAQKIKSSLPPISHQSAPMRPIGVA
jgi:hypothetical protein